MLLVLTEWANERISIQKGVYAARVPFMPVDTSTSAAVKTSHTATMSGLSTHHCVYYRCRGNEEALCIYIRCLACSVELYEISVAAITQ